MKMKIIYFSFALLILCVLSLTFSSSIFSGGSSAIPTIRTQKTEIPSSFPEFKSNVIKPAEFRIEANTDTKLTEIIAFHVALIAFFIPLSVEMVGRISERYGSSVISRYYMREKVPHLIFYLSIANILLSVFLVFFSNSIKILNYLSLGIFTITLFLTIAFLRTLYLYLTDIDSVIGKLIRDIKNVI